MNLMNFINFINSFRFMSQSYSIKSPIENYWKFIPVVFHNYYTQIVAIKRFACNKKNVFAYTFAYKQNSTNSTIRYRQILFQQPLAPPLPNIPYNQQYTYLFPYYIDICACRLLQRAMQKLCYGF